MSASRRGGTGAFPQREIDRRERNLRRDKRKTPFSKMTVAELRVWAQRFDIPNYAKMVKLDLAEAVMVAFKYN